MIDIFTAKQWTVIGSMAFVIIAYILFRIHVNIEMTIRDHNQMYKKLKDIEEKLSD